MECVTEEDKRQIIEELESIATSATRVPGLRRRAMVDVDRLAKVGDEIRSSIPSDMQEAHAWILELNLEIESMLVPGMDCCKICDHAFAKAEGCSYGDTFMGVGDNHLRFIGHGIGLELDEWPVLTSKSSFQLKPGMVLAVEPKMFFQERGGVGIENMYLITEAGCEKLTSYSDEIIVIPGI